MPPSENANFKSGYLRIAGPQSRSWAPIAETWVAGLAHSFKDTSARAVIVAVKALVDAAMREAQPDQAFPGYTDTVDLAAAIHGIVGGDTPNGVRRDLTEA